VDLSISIAVVSAEDARSLECALLRLVRTDVHVASEGWSVDVHGQVDGRLIGLLLSAVEHWVGGRELQSVAMVANGRRYLLKTPLAGTTVPAKLRLRQTA
jgi:hypothetical protein